MAVEECEEMNKVLTVVLQVTGGVEVSLVLLSDILKIKHILVFVKNLYVKSKHRTTRK